MFNNSLVGLRVFALGVLGGVATVLGLASNGLTPDEIVTWAVHPGGPRILNAFAEAMSIPPAALSVSREIMQTHGNMSSPTVLFVLDCLRERGAIGPCVAIGFGPGLVAEAALIP